MVRFIHCPLGLVDPQKHGGSLLILQLRVGDSNSDHAVLSPKGLFQILLKGQEINHRHGHINPRLQTLTNRQILC